MRVAILTEIPAPFRVPIFRELAAREDVALDVLFLRRRDPLRPYRIDPGELAFPCRVLPGVDRIVRGRWLILSVGVRRALRSVQPQLILLGGWNQPAFWTALAYARVRRIPAVAWVESTSRDERRTSPALESTKRAFMHGCSAFLVPGTASRAYVESLGVEPGRIAIAPNAVDLDVFGRRVAEVRRERNALRERLGVDGCCILAVARLAPEKGLDVLLDAARDLDVQVVIAGSGPEESRLRALAPPNARFLGQLDRTSLVPWYAAADVLVLPSRSEPWGFPVNEGAAAGLPLVATDAAGAAYDLIDPGRNGFRVPSGDVAALREALRRLAEDPVFRAAAGARSAEIGNRFTPAAWAEAVARLARRSVS